MQTIGLPQHQNEGQNQHGPAEPGDLAKVKGPGMETPGRGVLGRALVGGEENEEKVKCPNCQHPVLRSQMKAGICPDCKGALAQKHGKVLMAGVGHEAPGELDEDGSEPDETGRHGGRHSPSARHFDDGSGTVATTEDGGEEGFLNSFCRDFAVNRAAALEMIQAVAIHVDGRAAGSGPGAGAAPALALMKRAQRIIRGAAPGRPQALLLDCLTLAMHWYGELGGMTKATELADKWGVTKQDVNKQVNLFRDIIPGGMVTLPDLPGNRTAVHRAKFARGTKKRHEARKSGGRSQGKAGRGD